jgi:hypothetical protein
LLVVVPAGATSGKISVRTDASNTAALSPGSFTILEKPKINLIDPPQGTVAELIKIQGLNFARIVSVSLDGVTTNVFKDTTANKIELRIPATERYN